jgi:hypothetical protein
VLASEAARIPCIFYLEEEQEEDGVSASIACAASTARELREARCEFFEIAGTRGRGTGYEIDPIHQPGHSP